MMEDKEKLYCRRLRRYVTALNNRKPDRVPVRPFAAEFTGRHAGYTCQQLSQNYQVAFDAMVQCCRDYDWDAVPASMVYVWTGITDAAGVKYYGVPGINMAEDFGFQYREPPEERAFMRGDEYDRLIDDPTAFLYEIWLPRASSRIQSAGEPVTFNHNVALTSAAMAVSQYFNAFGPQCARLRTEVGMPGAMAGIFKAPLDIIGDKMRGYLGLTMDLIEQPEKVMRACEALMPHLFWVANATADPGRQLPVGYWMHRGCVPFVRPESFDNIYWPTVKPIIEELWKGGHQTLFYAEGSWDYHLDSFRELPDRSIIYHIDRGDPELVHRKLHDKFALSGGLSNVTMAMGTPEQVREEVRFLIENIGRDGGYILDASAIMQNDTKPENMRAMVDAAHEFGVYADGVLMDDPLLVTPENVEERVGLSARQGRSPGVCFSWDEYKAELKGPMPGSEEFAERLWHQVDANGAMFIWQMLLSF